VVYGRYKVIPIRADIIRSCEAMGFDYMGAIIWQKKTTMNTSGGAVVMGSYPYPRNGIVEIDYEFILLFKKLGTAPRVSREVKEASRLSREEWKEYFKGHWYFGGEKQNGHLAMFPEELPRRLVKMFTFMGDTVLDPFLGSGTTVLASHRLGRNSIGYEINRDFLAVIRGKLQPVFNDTRHMLSEQAVSVQFAEQGEPGAQRAALPQHLPTASQPIPRIDPRSIKFGSIIGAGDKVGEGLNTVREILDVDRVRLDTGVVIRLLGVEPWDDQGVRQAALDYLEKFVGGKKVILRFDAIKHDDAGTPLAYLFLKNRIFINAELIKTGLAKPSLHPNFRYAATFARCLDEAKRRGLGVWSLGGAEVA
jgi:site-specific DNA-methyltransferase (adenine-specific)